MFQTIDCDLLQYTDDSYLIYNDEVLKWIK